MDLTVDIGLNVSYKSTTGHIMVLIYKPLMKL